MSEPTPGLDALPRFVVDRTSPVPLYYQVAQHLEDAIHSGAVPTGTLFQNEVDLAASLGLSRPTMRRAMQHLVDKGLVVRRRGIGTRVVQPKLRRSLELTSLNDDLTRAGRKPTTEVLSFERVQATDVVAERLEVPEATVVHELVRIRRADGEPIARLINYLPEHIVAFDELDLAEHGLYELIRRQGVVLHSATQTLGARTATAAEARLMSEPRGAALVTAQRVTYDDHGQAVEFGNHIYASSRYTFEINLLTT
ncbi:MAG: GntR family transcriptional regulator [Marmoricola sp.]|jgi:GntR family transcriptional regulator|nr:GntR family transcriptional regulator [Marmoricola sp.]